jgi:hypothetical protein
LTKFNQARNSLFDPGTTFRKSAQINLIQDHYQFGQVDMMNQENQKKFHSGNGFQKENQFAFLFQKGQRILLLVFLQQV